MRILGLGKPDKVPPLTEKAAIELGGDLLSEFFVFGTAASLIMIEYLRQSSNKTSKDNALYQQVQDLDAKSVALKEKLAASEQRLGEMSAFLASQKSALEQLSGKVAKMEVKKRFGTQATQTTTGRQVGKVILATVETRPASADVTNSILYQCTEEAVKEITGRI